MHFPIGQATNSRAVLRGFVSQECDGFTSSWDRLSSTIQAFADALLARNARGIGRGDGDNGRTLALQLADILGNSSTITAQQSATLEATL